MYSLFYSVPTESLCKDGELRLDTTGAAFGGRLDICHKGIWGSVCNEMWTATDATVACNQLGLTSAGMNPL